ncbi:ComEA family DNA-binding protein, partial [Olsenella profusa]
GGDAAAGDAGDEAPVNINTADVAELDELPGVGEATAAAIVEDRERNGPFAAPEDLMRVSGIGEKKFEKLEGLICV